MATQIPQQKIPSQATVNPDRIAYLNTGKPSLMRVAYREPDGTYLNSQSFPYVNTDRLDISPDKNYEFKFSKAGTSIILVNYVLLTR